MNFPESLTSNEQSQLFSGDFLWVGLRVTDAGLLCVSGS